MKKDANGRPIRVPLGTRNVLTAPKKEGFVRRFVNDDADRVKQFEAAGYKVVRENIVVGDPRTGKGGKVGTVVSPSVGAGQKAVLMEIPQQYYDEDQKAKQDSLTTGEQDMKRQLNSGGDGSYGNVNIQ